jgi:hypothetical protein
MIRKTHIQATAKLTILVLLITVLFNSLNLRAQGILVKADLDSSAILIGDQIHLNFFVEQPQEAKIVFPSIKDSLAGKIEIMSASKIDTFAVGNGRLRLTQHILITCFDSGVYQITPFKFAFSFGKVKDSLQTNPLVLTVHTIPIKDPKKIADIKGLIGMPITFAEILPYLIGGLGALLVIALLVYIYLRIKNKKPIFRFLEKPAEPAHIVAFRELEKLKADKLWQQGQYKQYHTRLTDIVRTYIEGRFNVLALESTSLEILESLKKLEDINPNLLSEIKLMLELSDFVKFAKAEPMPDENENSWQVAFNFVKTTHLEPVQSSDVHEKVA